VILEIFRAYYFQKANQNAEFRREDVISFLWASITVHVGIVAVSGLMVKPLFTRWKRLFKPIEHPHQFEAAQKLRRDDARGVTPRHKRGRRRRSFPDRWQPEAELDIEDYKDIGKDLPLSFLLSGPFCKGFPPEE
jgi:hypothetical protein